MARKNPQVTRLARRASSSLPLLGLGLCTVLAACSGKLGEADTDLGAAPGDSNASRDPDAPASPNVGEARDTSEPRAAEDTPEGEQQRGEDGSLPSSGPDAPEPAEGASPGDSTTPAETPPSGPVECVDGAVQIGSAPMRRLSSREYLNTLEDLFPDHRPELPTLPLEAPVDSFDNDALALAASDIHVARWEEIAFRYTEQLTASTSALEEFLPCAAEVDDESSAQACGAELVDAFGLATHRRPLTPEEQDRYQSLFEEQLTSIDFEAAVQLTVMAMMQSPRFLYRLEIDGGTSSEGVVPLDSWELASRLSYFLWQRMPDAELFDAARADLLTEPDELERQVRRMLDDPRARAAAIDFHRQWLFFERIYREEHDTRVPAVSEDWSAANQDSAYEELTRFVETTIFDEQGTLEDLLMSRTAWVDERLADIYGVEGPSSEDEWEQVTLPEDERAGFLTRVGFLAAHAHTANGSPPLRGVYVMQRLFCLPPIPPPPDANTAPPSTEGTALTNRQLFEERTSPVDCQGCHTLIDSFGFGFEHYDAIGAYRELDNGQPVNATVSMVGSDVAGEVDNAIEMSQRLAESEQVAACVVSRWYRYSRGRSLEAVDECTLETINERFNESGGSILELMVQLTLSPDFRHRPAQ